MFRNCNKCHRRGENCVASLMLLPFAELINWCNRRQKFLGWTNQDLADQSGVPISTINRIKSGDYMDCKFSTIQHILIVLIVGTNDELPCTAQVEKEFQHIEDLERQVANLPAIIQENAEMKARLSCIDEMHRSDIRAVKAEYMEQIKFLMEELKAWRTLHQK